MIRTLQLGPEAILVILELEPSAMYGTPQLQPAIRTLIRARSVRRCPLFVT